MIRNMELSKQFIEEIKRFETIYCLVSGGWHSTTSALLLKENGFENVVLCHNNTLLERRESLNIIEKIREITGYEYVETKPDLSEGETVWDIMKRSFQKIPEVREDIINKKYDRTKFECCSKLKKSPARKFYKIIDKKVSIVISSICPYESGRRSFHLQELRYKNTFIRLHKKFGNVWHGYPFRDYFNEKEFREYLWSRGFRGIQHSGCVICPILIVFKMHKESRYYNSLKAMARAGLPCFEKTIMDFL